MKQPIRFGKYLLLDRINVGGMAEVFKAKTFGVEGFEKLVAIKRILPSIAEDDEFIKMFIDEAKITVKLQHANIAQVYELGKLEDSYFIAMEFINGKDLKQLFERNRKFGTSMGIAQACYIISQVCAGLDYAHRKKDDRGIDLNIIHRDVSPQNIRISYDGEVKIIDFGIAKAKNKSSKTEAGILKGKFGYMSPEQVRGQTLDRRSDIFAIGIIFYELVANVRLFQGETDFSTLEKIRNVVIEPLSTHNSDIPPELEKIIMKSLAKDRKVRYEYAHDMHDDLQRFMILNNYMYSRSELSNWMKETYNADIKKDLKKLKSFNSYTQESLNAQSQKHQNTVSGFKNNHIAPPKSSMSNPRIEAMEWDDDEMETQIFDKSPSFVGKKPEQSNKEPNIQQKLLEPQEIPSNKNLPNKDNSKKTVMILIIITILSLIAAIVFILKIMKTNTPSKEYEFILSVISEPKDELEIKFNDKIVGNKTPQLIQGVKEGKHKIVINKEGFEKFEKILPIEKKSLTDKQLKDGIITLNIKLKEKLLKKLIINSTPSKQLKVYLNDELISNSTPYTIPTLKSGNYNLKIEKEGYKTYKETIEITKKDLDKGELKISPTLEEGKPIEVNIAVSPSSAKLLIDGKKIAGNSPFKLKLVEGKHKIKIVGSTFDPVSKEIKVSQKNNSFAIKSKEKYVFVNFVTNPTGAKVYLIDKNDLKSAITKTTPIKEKIEFANVAYLRFEKDNHTPKVIPFKWNGNSSQTIKLSLSKKGKKKVYHNKKVNKATSYGYVSIMSRPVLQVKIDGKKIGRKTPLIKYKLSVGKHRVTLYGKDGISDSFTIKIKKDKVSPVIKKY